MPTQEPRSQISTIGCTWNGTYIVTEPPPILLSSGLNNHGQLGQGQNPLQILALATAIEYSRPPVALACGSEHVVALTFRGENSESQLWGWGWNEHGNLGLGHLNDVFTPQRVDVSEFIGTGLVVDIWAGCGTSWLAVEYSE